MRIRLLAIALLIWIVGIFAPLDNRVLAQATPPYDYEYNSTNLYTSADLVYDFTNLNPDLTYIWYVYLADKTTGFRTTQIGTRVSASDGVRTTDDWVFGASSPDRYPANYSGPIYVTDMFGYTLGKHYVTPSPISPTEPYSNVDWFSSDGNTDLNEKQLVAPENLTADSCQSPLFADLNSDGWHHTKVPCSVITVEGDYALLHYIIDPALYPAGTDDFIEFRRVQSAAVIFSVAMDDLIDYQLAGGFSGTISYAQTFSFVVLNTAGTDLPFIDATLSEAAFVTLDNPHTATFDAGAYNCNREETGPTFISDCESVWLVSNDPTGIEWDINATVDPVSESGNQSLTVTAQTEEIWDSYNGFQRVLDSTAGYSDTTVYSFRTAGTHTYVTANTATTDVEVTWTHRPLVLFSGLASESEMEFIVSDTYTIDEVVTFEEALSETIGNSGLDTELGRTVILMLSLFVGLAGVAMISQLRNQPMAYLIVWTAIGGGLIALDVPTLLGKIGFAGLTAMLWIFVIASGSLTPEHE